MFSNNLVSLVANAVLYLITLSTTNDDTLSRVLSDGKLFRDVVMIGTSGAIG